MDAGIVLDRFTDDQLARHNLIVERTKERLNDYTTHLLQRFFDIRRLRFPANLGSFAWSSPTIHVRWLSAASSINHGGGYVTPADLARDYLATKYANRRIRCTTDQWQKCIKVRKQPPLYCQPQRLDRAAYVDIRAAYWQVVRSVGWDVSYNPERFIGCNSRMIDFPYVNLKMARNCLVSVGIPAPMRMWTGKEIKISNRPSRFVNLILWRLVMDVLNGVAADMVEAGAAYVYTDGYIVPDQYIPAAFDVLNDWGLEGTIKHYGSVDIAAPASYGFTGDEGSFQTKVYSRRQFRTQRPVNKIDNSGSKWLRPRFQRFAEFAKSEWEWFEKDEK